MCYKIFSLIMFAFLFCSCRYDQASLVIRNESNDSVRIDFYCDTNTTFIGNPMYAMKDSIQLDILRKRVGPIKLYDSLVTGNIVRNRKNENHLFYKYYKDYVPVSTYWNLIQCNSPRRIFMATNTDNLRQYTNVKDLCKILDVPPSIYYKNDTLNYKKLLMNILPVYLPPGKSLGMQNIKTYGASTADMNIQIYKKIEIIYDGSVFSSFTEENFKKYFKKTNVFGSKDSYMLIISNSNN